MSDYTPKDKDVRDAYTLGARPIPPFYDPRFQEIVDSLGEEFDRWVVAHDAEVIRQYRIEEYRKRARNADLDWEEFGDVNYVYERDHCLQRVRELEDEK